MAKIKLTKNEQKKLKDSLKMYTRYLPTLQLKKQQLQMEIRTVEARLAQLEASIESLEAELAPWIAVFAEEGQFRDNEGLPLLRISRLKSSETNIAGVVIPSFEALEFQVADYDLYSRPLWIDRAVEAMKRILSVQAEHSIVQKEKELLTNELRITTQRVNLFEKVKIPQTRAAIKRIGIYLGDQQTAQVVRGKMSKRKVEEQKA
ncbi:MAG: V-type ATP synthase subunit D [Spirochaetia bacterium]|jgi:V/A-type H+-transporting ATPase subunit D|nr:V-type ATP synthase subunit D [Spirochaetales bacterium]MDX9783234.1 V-type ATP synthase subunit D [Spirochaetia bacterium]